MSSLVDVAVPLVLGVLPGARFERGSRRLEPGEVLIAYTDGVTKATGLGGREYGMERLVMTAAARSGQSADRSSRRSRAMSKPTPA